MHQVDNRAQPAQLAKLTLSTLLSVISDRSSQLLLLSFVVMSGPSGEETGYGSLALLAPVVLLGFFCGTMVDRFNTRRVLMFACIARGIVLLAAPSILSSFAAQTPVLSLLLALISTFTVVFSLGRFAIIPQIFAPRQIQFANSLLWFVSGVASIAAVYGISLVSIEPPPSSSLKIASIVYIIAAIAADLIKMPTRQFVRTPAKDAIRRTFAYLAKHRATGELIRLNTVLSLVFALWNVLLLCFAIENFQPGGTDLHPLFLFSVGGCALGSILATKAAATARSGQLLCTTLCALFLLSIICVGAQNLSVVKLALGLAGICSGLSLVTLDTMLQRIIPEGMRGTIAGCRDAIVVALCLGAMIFIESSFEQVSLVNIFREVGLAHVGAIVFLYLTWTRFSHFVFRTLVVPFLARSKQLYLDSMHYVRSAHSTIFVVNEVEWLDIATISGAFAGDCCFLVISKRKRSLERFLLHKIGGLLAKDNEEALRILSTKLRFGFNVFLLCDDLSTDGSKLARHLIQLAAARKAPLVPCAIKKDAKLSVRFGVPMAMDRSATPAKLAKELSFLQTAALEGGNVG